MASYCKREVPFTLHSKIDYNWLQFLTVDMMIFACWLASWIVLGHTVKVSIVEWTDWNTYLVAKCDCWFEWNCTSITLCFEAIPSPVASWRFRLGIFSLVTQKSSETNITPTTPACSPFYIGCFFWWKRWPLSKIVGDWINVWGIPRLRCFLGWLGWWCRSIPSSNRGGPSLKLCGDDKCREHKVIS